MNPITEIKGRKVLFENDMCRSVGMIATCNSCDSILYEDEGWLEDYKSNGGYCKECSGCVYDVISPDGFSINREGFYNSIKEAKEGFVTWRERFRSQGYYSNSVRHKIPLNELHHSCYIAQLVKDKEADPQFSETHPDTWQFNYTGKHIHISLPKELRNEPPKNNT